MKLKTLLCSLVTALVALAATDASAFPLYLNSLTGTLTTTAQYGSTADTTSNRVTIATVTLKQAMSVISNTVTTASGTNVPADAKVAYNPYTGITYLTNSSGYFYDLSTPGTAKAQLEDIATSFHKTTLPPGGTETDTIVLWFRVSGTGTDGKAYYFSIYGKGRLTFSIANSTGRGPMTISGNGADYGRYKSSDDGVGNGTVSFSGSGTPEWGNNPFSVWWED
ncbi:MAG: hypothetical protein JWM68_3204 [Verrucomicrobiales bacterium]|nr:hypothetical protein [Verrucomicrobiales bacterium]